MNDIPTTLQKARDAKVLIDEHKALLIQYRAFRYQAGLTENDARGPRPTNAKVTHARNVGAVYGIEMVVRDILSYWSHGDAVDVLDIAIGELADMEVPV